MIHVDFPFNFDGRGRTAATPLEEHVRDLIELVLFTTPGERVNRPDFGSGLLQQVFEPNDPTMATTSSFLVQGELQRWLGDLIAVEGVEVSAEDSTLRVVVQYQIRRTREQRVATLTREV
jgi:phage baseplate assembly protein W